MNNKKPSRRSTRLQKYDYSQEGMYFVTICTHQRQCIFGEIVNANMQLNSIGRAIDFFWKSIPTRFSHVEMDEYVIMPNHMHGIISIVDSSLKIPIGSIIRSFKGHVTKWTKANANIDRPWQRNYYEHVIRNERDYDRIAEYISTNPIQWELDTLHPKNALDNPLFVENP